MISEHDTISGYPLTWPTGWARTDARWRERARFGDTAIGKAVRDCYAELERMCVGHEDVVISSNIELRLDGQPRSRQRVIDDPGIAVWFEFCGEQHVLACDKWDLPWHNLRAIVKHIEAMRGMDRWGVGSIEQAFSGYKGLPEPSGSDDWWQTLGLIEEPKDIDTVRTRYRTLVKAAHPDQGGDRQQFEKITAAMRRGEELLA